MRKILFGVLGCLVAVCAHAAQIVNVDYVHKLIAQKWDVSVPIKADSPMQVANMKYLLTAVDVANEILNGEKTTDYGNGEFATLQVADTTATNQAVETLIKKEQKHEFTLTTIPNTNSFDFRINAAGEFIVDWGDGTVETITHLGISHRYYSHDYSTTGEYTIKLAGQATAYPSYSDESSSIRFQSASKIASIDGSLGAIFGTLADGSQPSFYKTFYTAYNIKAIPDKLFSGISGAPTVYMFAHTFLGCTGLTSIPENLFGNISGTAQSYMFSHTFYNCTSLTGPSARINGQYLYEIWPSATTSQVNDMYYGASKLSDYLYIPVAWGGMGVTTNEYPSAPSDAVYDFYLTTTSDTDVFAMQISAAGEFYIDWGDGKTEWVTKPDTTDRTYSHKYATAGAYTIGIGGQATAYNTNTSTATISFYSSASIIASIDGSLGAIFGTLSSGTNNQPSFYYTFYNATNMTGSIPSDLFTGISGAPASYMFYRTFEGCSGLTGSIPSDLFAGISGAPAFQMFYRTFSGCGGLTGSIPAGLFGNLTGAPAYGMFESTFSDCSGLTGAIPDGLFGNLSGAPATRMFYQTFYGCSKLTSISENLFGNISGTAQDYMFHQTFYNCKSLTGPSARINGQYLYEIWPSATSSQFYEMYYNATGLSDYSNIPIVWK